MFRPPAQMSFSEDARASCRLTSADDVEVRVVETGNDAAVAKVEDLRVRSALVVFRVVHANDAAILDGKILCLGMLWVERGDAPVVEDQVSNLRLLSHMEQ